MVIYLKGISEEGLLFNGNVKVINASLKFLIQVTIKKRKLNLYKNQIYIANLKNFSNQRSGSASVAFLI